mmetsp:Transcript_412/g.1415  ORF Transcript_412/g.1415 Transcript_412/m.1415 type:complete len:183 (+) Transcript_412:2319-2867(+)
MSIFASFTSGLAGFQVEVVGPEPISAGGGLIGDSGFSIALNKGVVIAYALSGALIQPQEDAKILTLTFAPTNGELVGACLVDVIVSGAAGVQMESAFVSAPVEPCVVLGQDTCPGSIELGDGNLDGTTNILDVILLINFIIDGMEPSPCAFAVLDVNSSAGLDILDVIALVNIIIDPSQLGP